MEKLAVAVVRTSHGVRGYVKVTSLSGETEHLLKLEELSLRKEGREKGYRVEDMRPIKDGLLLKLEGVDTPEEGKRLAGSEIWVDRDAAARLAEGEYYISDMIGCSLLFEGKSCGEIVAVGDNGVSDLLEVETRKGIRIVPFTARFIGTVDLEAGVIELLDGELLE